MRAAILIVALASGVAYADDIRVDGGFTGSSVGVSGRDGVGMVTEIKGMVNDNLAIGGRVEFAVMFGGHIGQDDLPLDIAMAACGLVKAEMYLTPGQIRPFVSLGAGAYTIGSQSIDDGPNTAGIHSSVGRYVGVAPEIGVDLGRVRLAATYNAILGASLEVRDTNTMSTTRVSQNYLSLELSFAFSTGRKHGSRVQPE
jgi:hypothetical protein